MKLLGIIRHGRDMDDGRLSPSGHRQMKTLATGLKPYLADHSVRMIVSTAPRAVESAEILADDLGLTSFEQNVAFWSDKKHPQDLARALALVKEKSEDVDALLVVTHLEYAAELPSLYGREVLRTPFPYQELLHGEACLVHCEKKKIIAFLAHCI